MTRTPAAAIRGFSLAEALVALALGGILLAGMVQVFAASLASWSRVNGALAARRTVDWALARMAIDLELAGHLLPLPGRSLPPMPGEFGWPGGWRLAVAGPDSDVPSELAFVYDRPVPVELAEAVSDGPAAGEPVQGPARTVRLRARHALRLRAGDLLLAPGARFEWAAVAAAADLAPGRPAAVPLAPAPDGGGWTVGRPAGTPLELVRPGRLVRYAVVALGPEDVPRSDGTPCLVRFEAQCPADGREPPWAAALGRGGRPRGLRHEVLARGVHRFRAAFLPGDGRQRGAGGFRVDLAVAGPAPGARAAGTLRLALRNGGR